MGGVLPEHRRGRLKRWLWILALSLAVLYVGSYFALTRYSRAITRADRVTGYYYVPCRLETIIRHKGLQRLHVILCDVYRPLDWLDQALLGGEGPAGLPETGIGGGDEPHNGGDSAP